MSVVAASELAEFSENLVSSEVIASDALGASAPRVHGTHGLVSNFVAALSATGISLEVIAMANRALEAPQGDLTQAFALHSAVEGYEAVLAGSLIPANVALGETGPGMRPGGLA